MASKIAKKCTGWKCLGGTSAITIAVVLLYFSFRNVEWKDFFETFASCNWPLMMLSAVVGMLMPACRALRWRLTVEPFCPQVRRSDSILANYVGYLVNMAVPFTHEVTRCVVMRRRTDGKTNYDALAGVAIVERICDALCVLLLFLVTTVISNGRYIPFMRNSFSSWNISRVVIIVVMACIAFVVAAYLVRKYRIYNLKRPWLYVAQTAILWFIYWLQLYLGVRAMPCLGGISATDCVFLTFAVSVSSLVPAPGGFGTFHFMVASVLCSLYGVPWNDGLAFATLVHESQAILMVLAGVVSAVVLKNCSNRVPREPE